MESKNSNSPVYIKRKGGIVMVYGGLEYYKHKTYKNGNQFWVCSESKKKNGKKCLGSVTVQNDQIVKAVEHTTKIGDDICVPDFAKIEVMLAIENAESEAMVSTDPLQSVYERAMEPLYSKGINLVTKIPPFSSKKHVLNNKRNEGFQQNRTTFKDIWEVEIPGKFSDLILADYNDVADDTRIILLVTEFGRNKIKSIDEYFIDGTFYTAPKPFYQVLVIHGENGSSSNNTKTVPLIFALMNNKTEKSYSILFDLITVRLPNWKPKKIHADFEFATTNALKYFFPDIIIKRCYFHFTKCLLKKSKKLCLNAKVYTRIVGLCTSLALLPEELILEGWQYILCESENLHNKSLKEFIKYVEKYYINKNINEWCVYNERHRTNNVAESWNSNHNKKFKKPYVTLNKFLNVISQNNFYEQSASKRRKEYCERDEFILSTQIELLTNQITVGHFLDKLR